MQALRHANDGLHRRAQFVAGHRQKFGLGLARPFGLVEGFGQRRFVVDDSSVTSRRTNMLPPSGMGLTRESITCPWGWRCAWRSGLRARNSFSWSSCQRLFALVTEKGLANRDLHRNKSEMRMGRRETNLGNLGQAQESTKCRVRCLPFVCSDDAAKRRRISSDERRMPHASASRAFRAPSTILDRRFRDLISPKIISKLGSEASQCMVFDSLSPVFARAARAPMPREGPERRSTEPLGRSLALIDRSRRAAATT